MVLHLVPNQHKSNEQLLLCIRETRRDEIICWLRDNIDCLSSNTNGKQRWSSYATTQWRYYLPQHDYYDPILNIGEGGVISSNGMVRMIFIQTNRPLADVRFDRSTFTRLIAAPFFLRLHHGRRVPTSSLATYLPSES